MKKNAPQWWSLKTRMTLFTLCVFLVGIWSLFIYASGLLYRDLTRRFGEQQLSTASTIAKAIDTEFDVRFESLDEAAAASAPLMSDRPALQASLELRSELLYLFSGGIIITDNEGKAVADLPRKTGRIGQYYGGDAWVSAALHEGRSSVGYPIVGKVLHVPVFAMTVPIRNAQGGILGSLNGVVVLQNMTFMDVIAGSRYGASGGYLVVAPQSRQIVTGSDKRSVLEKLPPRAVNPSFDRLLESREGGTTIASDFQGQEVLSSSSVIPASGWRVVVSLPTAEAFAPIHHLQQQMLLATLFLTLGAGCLTWWMMRRQLAALTNAVKTLAALSSSDLPVQDLPVGRKDEVGELIGGFNRLLEVVRRQEESLRESHKILRSILSTTRDGYWRADFQGRLIDANQTYVQQSGYAHEELIGMRISDLEAKESGSDVARHIQQVIKDGSDQFESRHRRKDGSIWDVEISTMCHSADSGQFFVFIRDITERKRAAEETAKLQAQFQQSQKMESVGRLAGGVAHDFNNMLGVILGRAELAIERVDPSQAIYADLKDIREAATRSADLTRQLLAFARKQTVEPKVLDLNHTVSDILEMLKRMIGENIQITWKPGENLWPIKMDPSQINQILANMCVNARDAIANVGTIGMETKNIEIDADYCASLPDAEPGEYVLLSVSDNGCGMDRTTLARIFDPFFTTKPMGRGTGLGLATVYGTVKQNKGFINVYSEPGSGTTFKIYLPRHAGRPGPKREEGTAGQLLYGDETILLVEDEPVMLKMTKTVIARLGYTVLAAKSPGEAMRLAEEHSGQIHLLMTDVIMPEMNGRILAERLLSLNPGLKCLFTSGYTDDIISSQGMLEENVNFISKPFTMETLMTKLREVLDVERRIP